MAMLATIKQRLGVFYSEPFKDAEIAQMIAGAKAFFTNAGVPASALEDDNESAEAIEAIAIWCKMAINTDPVEMRFNSVLVALIDQLRNAPKGTP